MSVKTMIPISRPEIGSEEIEAVKSVLESGMLAQGAVVEEFEHRFASLVGVEHAIATNSGTSALHTALAAAGIKRGDEVITTAFSFFATASCILMQGARPVFVDIDPRTYNIDPGEVERAITERTKAIIPVHLYGQPCAMNELMEIAEEHQILVIEDAAQAHGAVYGNMKVGSIGDIGVFSFYSTKNIITGEGGMITTDDGEIADKARMIRNHGQSRRYIHECLGYNYRMTNIAAAIGLVQLNKLDRLNSQRIENARYYSAHLNLDSPYIAPGVRHVFHQYTVRVKNRDRFLQHLDRHGVGYGVYYPMPLPDQPVFRSFGCDHYPEAQLASAEVVSLPVHPTLNTEEIKKVVEVVNQYEG